MTAPELSDLLERAADQIPVGPAPVGHLLARATRHRRWRTVAVVASSAAAVVVAMAGTALLLSPNTTPKPPVSTPSVAAIPPGTRLVGIGHAAIAVPESWGTNETQCGTPKKDTVVIDVGAIPACATGRPAGVESVDLSHGPPRFDFAADQTLRIDGVDAQRQATVCTNDAEVELCTGTVFIPSLQISFRAESSTSPAAVDEILSWIRLVPGSVGVPGFERTNMALQGGAGDRYVTAARAVGLDVRVVTKARPPIDPGFILGVTPQPGTMVAPGTEITLTVVAEPEGPADEVAVRVSSAGAADGEYQDLTDEQIRTGAFITLSVGDSIWASADGHRSRTLDGSLDGISLASVPGKSASWTATRSGTTRLTLTITADGAPVKLGVVSVYVR